MADRPFISFEQAQAAMKAMTEKAIQSSATPVAMAIVDEAGHLVAYAGMDNMRLLGRRHALRKAYTSAITGTDSGAHAERLKSLGRTVSDIGDPSITPGQGGIVVLSKDGVIMGGIGVGGYPSAQADEDLARVGLTAMNL